MNRIMIFSLLASACCGFFVPPAGPIEDCIHRSMNNHKFIRPTLHSQGFYNLNTIESAYSLFCYFVQYSALTYSMYTAYINITIRPYMHLDLIRDSRDLLPYLVQL